MVDDKGDNLTLFGRALQHEGISVRTFADPVETLREFQRNSQGYGLVVSDIRMAGMSGYELVIHIEHLKPEIKVVLTSPYETGSVYPGKCPIDELIFKPLRPGEFVEVVAKHLAASITAQTRVLLQ